MDLPRAIKNDKMDFNIEYLEDQPGRLFTLSSVLQYNMEASNPGTLILTDPEGETSLFKVR